MESPAVKNLAAQFSAGTATEKAQPIYTWLVNMAEERRGRDCGVGNILTQAFALIFLVTFTTHADVQREAVGAAGTVK